ncbi:LCP family protein [Phycicoccus sp. HDW14]|uniref:LCP family protein n=1 Tax=Phycicoccus sp. HDW14 TaxID=2714941 RepID=UPI00140ACFF2|nr:LCP family protein [Phycicoccus sp. HDW14]QIM22153.1 LCP family protein [Phycicoccus sp. HDW14]
MAGITAFVVVVALGAGYVWWRLDGNISRIDISQALSTDRPTVAKGPLNILLIGSDTRVGQDAPDSGKVSGARSDTTLIAHLSADRKHVTMVSIPRDSMVPMPPNCNAKVPKSEWPVQQFNAAFSIGGPACLINTVEANTDLFINHFAVVDFRGFRGMVDALGGVPVCTPVAIDDPKAHLTLAAGRHVLNGKQALGYVRVRYTEGDGSDLGRIKRQQAFLSSIVQEATRTSLLLRPDKLYGFLDAATKSLTTDEDMGLGTMKDIADSVKNVGVENVAFITVPVETYPEDPNRVQFTDAADTLWKALRADQPLTGKPKPSASPSVSATPLTVSPAKITVLVVNATGAGGLAAQVATALRVQGFARVTTSSTGQRPAGVTVEYAPGKEKAARTVAAAFPGAKLVEDPALDATVRVTLGAGAPAVVEVPNRLGSDPIPRPSVTAPRRRPRSRPAPPTRTSAPDRGPGSMQSRRVVMLSFLCAPGVSPRARDVGFMPTDPRGRA